MIYTKINGEGLEVYNAKLLDYEVGACDYKNGYVLPPTEIMPVKLSHTVGLRIINLELDFEGETAQQIESNVSAITAVLHQGAEILLPDGFYYRAYYEGASASQEKAPWLRRVKFKLSGYRHGELETHTLTESGTINVAGNCETPAILSITSDTESTVTVFGITITDAVGVTVIDGMKKTVMKGGLNKFADTDITQFPKLQAGDNVITIVGATKVEVSFYPIYL